MRYTCPALLANVGRGSQRRPALASSVGSIGQYATPQQRPYLPLCATIRRYPIRHYPQHRKTPYSVAGALANVGREQCRAMLGSVGQPAPDVGRERCRTLANQRRADRRQCCILRQSHMSTYVDFLLCNVRTFGRDPKNASIWRQCDHPVTLSAKHALLYTCVMLLCLPL
jgi:hypothetical protein